MTDPVVRADEASDEEVAKALGIGDDSEQSPGSEEQDGETAEQEEVDPIEALMAEIKELRKETATLKREQAAARVAAKRNKVATTSDTASTSSEDVAQAEERGREAARLEYGIRLAGAEVRAALATVIPDEQMDDFIDDLALSKYVGDDGEVDKDAIKALKDRQTALLGATRRTPKVNHGRTGKPASTKTTADQFADAIATFF